jgi:Zn-dependent protease
LIPQSTPSTKKSPWLALGAAGAVLLTKLKALLPLIKLGTIGGSIISMAVSIGAYTFVAPLRMAIGIVILVLIHELGHVAAARRKGLPTTAPVFIPLIGALVNMKRHPRDAATEAYIALGGPLIGALGALAALGVGLLITSPLWIAIAYVGILINLINLLPVFPLDGGKIAVAVSRWLWLVGLIVGLGIILYFRMYILLFIWLVFAGDLSRKALQRFGRRESYTTWSSFQVPAEPLEKKGLRVPGPGFRRELAFTTYSNLDGKQKVELFWDEVGLRGITSLPVAAIVKPPHAVRVDRRRRDGKTVWVVRCQVEYEAFVSDVYYKVPVASRIRIGLVYAALTGSLLYLMHVVAGIGMPD